MVVRDTGNELGYFLNSKKGVTQRDPLSMIAYGIGILPLIRELLDAHPRVTQPWYADGAGAWEKFGYIMEHFGDLQVRGPRRGYFLEQTKSILVVTPRTVARLEEFLRGMGINIVTGSRYPGVWQQGGRVKLVGGEDSGVDRFDKNPVGGCP